LNNRAKLIEEWFKVDQDSQQIIDEIIDNETDEQVEDYLNDKNKQGDLET
jgi:hypothetical protein